MFLHNFSSDVCGPEFSVIFDNKITHTQFFNGDIWKIILPIYGKSGHNLAFKCIFRKFFKLHVLITVITMEGFSQFGINDKKWNLEPGTALRLNLTPCVRLFDVISPLLLRRWDERVEYKPADVTSDLQPEEKIKPVLFKNRSFAAACAGFISWLNNSVKPEIWEEEMCSF